MPQGVTIIDDDPVRRLTEEKRQLDTRIATLSGKREEARATAGKKKAEVESLEKTEPEHGGPEGESRRRTPCWPRRKKPSLRRRNRTAGQRMKSTGRRKS